MVKKVKFPSFNQSPNPNDSDKESGSDVQEMEKAEDIIDMGAQNTQPDTQPEETIQEEKAVEEIFTVDPNEYRKILQERDEYLDHLRRLQAEFDNYRKRVQKEKSEMRDYLIQGLIVRLLEVIDNMDRALHPSITTHDVDSYRKGVEMVFDQMIAILKEQGLKRMETVGQPFDPRFHEAVGLMESSEYQPGCVAKEMLPGYFINDRLLRTSKVMVVPQSQNTGAGKPDSGIQESGENKSGKEN